MDQAQTLALTNIGARLACVASTARLLGEATEGDVAFAFDGIADQLTDLGAQLDAQIVAARSQA